MPGPHISVFYSAQLEKEKHEKLKHKPMKKTTTSSGSTADKHN